MTEGRRDEAQRSGMGFLVFKDSDAVHQTVPAAKPERENLFLRSC